MSCSTSHARLILKRNHLVILVYKEIKNDERHRANSSYLRVLLWSLIYRTTFVYSIILKYIFIFLWKFYICIQCVLNISNLKFPANLSSEILPQQSPHPIWVFSLFLLTDWVEIMLSLCPWLSSNLMSLGLHSISQQPHTSNSDSTRDEIFWTTPSFILAFWLLAL